MDGTSYMFLTLKRRTHAREEMENATGAYQHGLIRPRSVSCEL